MRAAGPAPARSAAKDPRTTVPADAGRPARRPGRPGLHRAGARTSCWVADITYVATWSGFVYVAFVIDVFSRRIVGWRASTTPAHRPGPRRPGAWPSGSAGRDGARPDRAGPPLRPRRAVPVHPLHRTPRRGRRRRLGRLASATPTTTPLAESLDRPVQDRADPPPRPLARPRRRRDRHPRMGRLVQPPPPAQRLRRHPTRRVRGPTTTARSPPSPTRRGGRTEPPLNPGRFRHRITTHPLPYGTDDLPPPPADPPTAGPPTAGPPTISPPLTPTERVLGRPHPPGTIDPDPAPF